MVINSGFLFINSDGYIKLKTFNLDFGKVFYIGTLNAARNYNNM